MSFTRNIVQINNNNSKATQDSKEEINSSCTCRNPFPCLSPSCEQCLFARQKLVENATEQKRTATTTSEPKIYSSSHEIERDSPTTMCDVKRVFESAEHVSCPTVSERKKALERKFSKGETFSSLANLRRTASYHDVTAGSLIPAPCRLYGARARQRKISSPLPASKPWSISSPQPVRRPAFSESAAEEPLSSVIPRRISAFENPCGLKHSRRGAEQQGTKSSFALDHPSARSNSEESITGLHRQSTSNSLRAFSVPDSSDVKTDHQEKFPQINLSLSPMLVRPVFATETARNKTRELFNVSPIMNQSANPTGRGNHDKYDVTEKVQYFLQSLSLTNDSDLKF